MEMGKIKIVYRGFAKSVFFAALNFLPSHLQGITRLCGNMHFPKNIDPLV